MYKGKREKILLNTFSLIIFNQPNRAKKKKQIVGLSVHFVVGKHITYEGIKIILAKTIFVSLFQIFLLYFNLLKIMIT